MLIGACTRTRTSIARALCVAAVVVLSIASISTIAQILTPGPTGGIISVSTDQPCVNVDSTATSGGSTGGMNCNKATILQLGLFPGSSDQPSPYEFTFLSVPSTDPTGSASFSGSGDLSGNQDGHFCSDADRTGGSQSCITSIPGAQPISITVNVSRIVARYQLRQTGILTPFTYLYNTGLYPYDNHKQSWSQCGVSPVTQNSKACETVIKRYPSGSDQMYAQSYVTNYGLAVPGSPNANPNNPESSQPAGGVLNIDGEDSVVRDIIYTRWFNGTLGCGGTVRPGIDIDSGNTATSNSGPPCNYASDTSIIGEDKMTTRPTRPVCPSEPIPCWKSRNGNINPTTCLTGGCAGGDDGICPLAVGFGYGGSRCVGSKETVVVGEETWPNCSPNDPLNECIIDTPLPACQRYKVNGDEQCFDVDTANLTLLETIDSANCFCVMCQYVNGDIQSGEQGQYPTAISEFPSVGLLCDWSPPGGDLGIDQSGGQSIFGEDGPLFCTSDTVGENNAVNLETLKCDCGCSSQWYDTVIPVGPVCRVFDITNPAVPMFTVDVTITNSSGISEKITVGTAANATRTGFVPFNISSDGTVRVDLLNIDTPRGSTLPTQLGYIVICGLDDNAQDNPSVPNPNPQQFIGSPDTNLGLINPFQALAEKLGESAAAGRMPLPSTYQQFADEGIIPEELLAKYNTGSRFATPAWWYFVPPSKVAQYGTKCNQNGWLNYGSYDYVSATAMCANRQGTCVPGYDIRGGGRNTQSDPIRFPSVNQPCNVARQFVEYEVGPGEKLAQRMPDSTDIPEFLPISWNPALPNTWVHKDGLFTDAKSDGSAAYAPGDVFIRTSISVAGVLIGEGVSISGGTLTYTDGDQTPPGDPTNPANTPLGSCYLSLLTLQGSLKVNIVNTGTNPGTYSVDANCTEGVILQNPPVDIPVAAGGNGVTFTTDIVATQALTQSPICTVRLFPATFDSTTLATLPVICSLTENVQVSVGGYVLGPGLGNRTDNPISPSSPDGNTAFCDSADWFCNTFGSAGGSSSFMDNVLSFVLLCIVLVLIATFACIVVNKGNERIAMLNAQVRSVRNGLRVSAERAKSREQQVERLQGGLAEIQ